MRASRNRTPLLDLLLAVAQVSTAAYGIWRRKSPPALPRMHQPSPPQPASGSPADRANGNSKSARKERERQDAEKKAVEIKANGSYLKSLLQVAIAAAKAWVSHRAASKGAALALYTLFSLAPMLVLVVTIAGFFFGADRVTEALLSQMQGLMGDQGAEAIRTILAGAENKETGLIAGLISIGLVLISATTAFAELKDSLDELWEVEPPETSGIWGMLRERVLSFGLLMVLALMLMITLAVSTALSAIGGYLTAVGGETFTFLMQLLSHVVTFGIVTLLFAVIFKYLPAADIAWKDVFVGALLTAVLFIIGKAGISLYVAKGDFGTAYGAAGSVVVLITWIYYSAQIFFYGALFTHEYASLLGSRQHTERAQVAQEGTQTGLQPA